MGINYINVDNLECFGMQDKKVGKRTWSLAQNLYKVTTFVDFRLLQIKTICSKNKDGKFKKYRRRFPLNDASTRVPHDLYDVQSYIFSENP